MQVELRERSFGELIGVSVSLAVAHFPKLFLLAVVCGLPNLVMQFVMPQVTPGVQPRPDQLMLLLGATFGIMIISLLVYPIQQGASVLIVAGSFTGDAPSLGESVTLALRRFGGLLGLGIVVGMIVGIGFAFCIVPGVIFLTWFYVATPALIVEEAGMQTALNRSKELSEDHRLEILGFVIVIMIMTVGPIMVVQALTELASIPHIAGIVVNYLLGGVVAPLMMVAPVAYYFDLRVRKDALDVDELAAFVDTIGEHGKAGGAHLG